MLYSDDVYLALIRYPILESYGVSSWGSIDLHQNAALRFERDVEFSWYRMASKKMAGTDWRSTPFDASLLLQGYDYLASGTVVIAENDVVAVPSGHVSGGTAGNYYQAQSALGSTALGSEDFTGSDWEDVTDNRIRYRDCVSYYALFWAYRYLANKEREDDYRDQREYWLGQYYAEFDKQMKIGVEYDFDGDGQIDYTEKSYGETRGRIIRV